MDSGRTVGRNVTGRRAAGGLVAAVAWGMLAASAAWACVSHTGIGTLDHEIVNTTDKFQANGDLNVGNYGDCVGRLGTPAPGCNGVDLPGVEALTGDDMVSQVYYSPNPLVPPATLAADLTGQYTIRMASSNGGTCAATSPAVWPPAGGGTKGPAFTANWKAGTDSAGVSFVTMVTGGTYAVCVHAPGSGVLPEDVVLTGG